MVRIKSVYIEKIYKMLSKLEGNNIRIRYDYNNYIICSDKEYIGYFNDQTFNLKLSVVEDVNLMEELLKLQKKAKQKSKIGEAFIKQLETVQPGYCLVPFFTPADELFILKLLNEYVSISIIERNQERDMMKVVKEKELLNKTHLNHKFINELHSIGITSIEDICTIGARAIFVMLFHSGNNPLLSTLLKLEATIRGLPVGLLDEIEVSKLKQFWQKYSMVKEIYTK